ncbi:hypothetical protein E3H11_44170, partial [Bradyrhizobium brasilense]|nr:hypothetical protein [Bradyrhizobium brasilense]
AYAFARWKRCRVGPDYHIEIDGHWYSAPYRLIRELVDARIDELTDEPVRRGIPVSVDLDMIVGADPASLPACESVSL